VTVESRMMKLQLQVEPMPDISYDTAFEVALSTRFILYYILERACIAAKRLRGHFVSGCVAIKKFAVFSLCANKGGPWVYCYIKQYFTVFVDILAESIY
jgi:riboflavin synthase alpha subunit